MPASALVEVDKPSPGPGEVLLRITASGLCRSDEFVMLMPEEGYPYPMPMTLGRQVDIRTTTYAIEDGERAYDDMHAGRIVGRAVVVP